MRPVDYLVFGGLAVALLVVLYLLFSTQEGEEDWEAYRREHHCQSVAELAGGNNSGWLCDDGEVHHRWRQQR